jgi:RimJ/RimL family protein N-acetyltransferase
MRYILETTRLGLRQFTISDANFIVELVNSPGWLEFIGDRNVKTEEQALAYLQNGPINSYEVNGFGLSLVELKSSKNAIGMCGILRRDNLEKPDIGFALLPEFIGKGYAFEIAGATLIFAKEKLKIPTVWAVTVPNNKASINLLEKIGMKFLKPFYFPEKTEELMLFTT